MRVLYSVTRWLLIIYVCLILMAAALLGTELKFHHGRLLTIPTSSMVPTMHPGDAVFIKPITGKIQTGQVITFISPISGQLVSHRVVAVDKLHAQLTTRGDNTPAPDTPIQQSAVVGRVVYVFPALGRFMTFLRRPTGIIIFLYVPALSLVFIELKRFTRHFGHGTYRLLGYR